MSVYIVMGFYGAGCFLLGKFLGRAEERSKSP